MDLDSSILAVHALLLGKDSAHRLRMLVREPGQKRLDDLAGLRSREAGGIEANEVRAGLLERDRSMVHGCANEVKAPTVVLFVPLVRAPPQLRLVYCHSQMRRGQRGHGHR